MRASAKALCSIALLTCVCATSSATDYTFNALSGDWNSPLNWQPSTGIPVDGDTATIPTNRTCIVGAANQTATRVTVASGGTLRIDNRNLTITANDAVGITVNGKIEFANTGVLCPAHDMTIEGSGSMTTLSGATAYMGQLIDEPSIWVTINQGVLIKGSFKIYCNLFHYGTLAVDNAEHDMEVAECDPTGYTIHLHGTGVFRATAGSLRFGRASIQVTDPMRLVVNGGTMKFCEIEDGSFAPLSFDVTVTAGTLIFDDTFNTSGHLDYSGGKIKVKTDQSATFSTIWE